MLDDELITRAGDTNHLDKTDSDTQPMERRITDRLDLRIPRQLRFALVSQPAVFEARMKERVMLGRKGGSSFTIDVDFGPFDGQNKGVSRQHAVIYLDNGRLTIKDMNSTNGTRLNGFKLQPLRGYRLRHGDELALGELRMRIFFNGLVV